MTTSSDIWVPETPAELGLDPDRFPEWRENQREVVHDIAEAFQSYDTVLVDAPTGSGKTVIGAAVARVLAGTAVYLAHTLILQRQQLRTLPNAVTVTGRRNHACIQPTGAAFGLTAEDANCPCEFARPGGCGYYSQWFDALEAQDVVLNYAYIVRVIKAGGLKVAPGYGTVTEDVIENPFKGRRLMVCDEGHNLEKALLDADTVEVSQASFARYGYAIPRSLDFRDWVAWANELAPVVSNLINQHAKVDSDAGAVEASLTITHIRERKSLKSLLVTLANIQDLPKRAAHTPFHVGRTPGGYQLRPLWAWDRAQHLLFQHAPNAMVMSATLGTPKFQAKLLGLDNWAHIKIPSTFPIQNRPVYYWPVSRMKYNMEESEKVKQAVALIHLANKFPDSPGLVHCNSYPLGRFLVDVVRRYSPEVAARLLTHDSATREATFETFEKHEGLDNAILVTPAASTGVDWDFVGWQMIPKIPFPDLSDDITRLRYDYVTDDGEAIGKEAYTQEAVKTLVQEAGRNVRTPTSRGVTVITDSAFWPLFKYTAADAFPDWFRPAVSWYEPKGA